MDHDIVRKRELCQEKKLVNTSFLERLWILINDKANGKPTVFARNARISSGTFDAYLDGRIPKAEQLVRIHETYGVDLTWLLTGKGEPYLTPESQPRASDYDPLPPEIADLLERAKQVLMSKNPIAYDALQRNINYFAYAIEKEEELTEVKDSLAAMKAEIASLREALTKCVPRDAPSADQGESGAEEGRPESSKQRVA